jgi:hypothetical protein
MQIQADFSRTAEYDLRVTLGNWHLARPPRYHLPTLRANPGMKWQYRSRTHVPVYHALSQPNRQARYGVQPPFLQTHGFRIRLFYFQDFINELYPEPYDASRIAQPYRASLRIDLSDEYTDYMCAKDLTNVSIAVNKQPSFKCRFEATGSRPDVVHELNSIFWPTYNSKLLPLIGTEITKMVLWSQTWDKDGIKIYGEVLGIRLMKNAGALMKASVPYPVAQQALEEFVVRVGLSRAKLLIVMVRHDLNAYEQVPGCAVEVKFDRWTFYGYGIDGTGRYKYDPNCIRTSYISPNAQRRAKLCEVIVPRTHVFPPFTLP